MSRWLENAAVACKIAGGEVVCGGSVFEGAMSLVPLCCGVVLQQRARCGVLWRCGNAAGIGERGGIGYRLGQLIAGCQKHEPVDASAFLKLVTEAHDLIVTTQPLEDHGAPVLLICVKPVFLGIGLLVL